MSEQLESFHGLLLRHRGRTGLTQRALAERVGVSVRSLQMWEAGVNYPGLQLLQSLIEVLYDAGGLTAGRETAEVEQLWAAAMRDGPRLRTPFDSTWFAELRSKRGDTPAVDVEAGSGADSVSRNNFKVAPAHHQEWGDAPDASGFVGRVSARLDLSKWIVKDRCRVVSVLGLGGMGKTILAARVAHDVADDFELVFWRSLRNAPPVSEWLGNAIDFLSGHQLVPPDREDARRVVLLNLLRERRCLIVLDNLETVLESNAPEERPPPDDAGFRGLVRILAESRHQSCALVTSREAPAELVQLGGSEGPVRALTLAGLSVSEARALLTDRQVWGDDGAWSDLVATYAGNGLALKVSSETIHQVFGGDIAEFVAYIKETYGTAVRGIRRLMDGQVERRLSRVELDVLRWMAIEREPSTVAELIGDVSTAGVERGAVVEAVESLRRRSLIERGERARALMLQSVVLEYVTDRLVEQAVDEITQGKTGVLVTYPLIQALSKDYVRASQERLIAQPLLERLRLAAGGSAAADQQLMELLHAWRAQPRREHGYGPGNVVNLLRVSRGELRGIDFSDLSIRQAYLQGVDARDASFSNAHVTEVVLAEAFEPVLSVALSADNQVVAVGTMGGEIRLWRVDDRTPLVSQRGHTGAVYGLALSADGQLLVSGGVDGRLHLWDGGTGADLTNVAAHSGGVYGVALSADGRVTASSGVDGAIRVWSAAGGESINTLLGHQGVVYDVALSPDGGLVVSAGEDATVRLWDVASGACLQILEGHSGPVRGVALTADCHLLASGGLDGIVRLWDSNTANCIATLRGHVSSVWSVAFAENGQLLASSGVDGTVRLWDVAAMASRGTLQGHAGAVWSVALNKDGRLAASGGVDGSVRLWETETSLCMATVQGYTSVIRGVALRADVLQVVSSGVDGTIRLWDVTAGTSLMTLQETPGMIYNLALSGDGSLLASGELDGRVRLRELETGRYVATIQAHTGAAYGVALNADASVLASSGIDGMVRLWRVDSGALLANFQGHTGAVWGVALSADGGLLASGGQDGTVRLWDVASGQCRSVLQANSGTVYCVALSGDGRLLASGGLDGTIRLWNPLNGQSLATLQANTGVIRGVALNRDGHVLASGGQDGTIRVWDTADRANTQTLRPDRLYQRMDITGMTGVTEIQHAALLALGAVDRAPARTTSLQPGSVGG